MFKLSIAALVEGLTKLVVNTLTFLAAVKSFLIAASIVFQSVALPPIIGFWYLLLSYNERTAPATLTLIAPLVSLESLLPVT